MWQAAIARPLQGPGLESDITGPSEHTLTPSQARDAAHLEAPARLNPKRPAQSETCEEEKFNCSCFGSKHHQFRKTPSSSSNLAHHLTTPSPSSHHVKCAYRGLYRLYTGYPDTVAHVTTVGPVAASKWKPRRHPRLPASTIARFLASTIASVPYLSHPGTRWL